MAGVRGITVVGCGVDSGEVAVARALAEAIPDARVFVTTELSAASPVIAARHAGQALDPAALVADATGDGPTATDSAKPMAPGVLARPLIAAKPMGPGAAGRPLIAAAPGGLMAPLTEHYSNRDFARELGLPLVIAAPAAGGVTGQVRLVGEAARAAGLAVAAVVLTDWPDPPNRVQLDERELLSKIARAPVLAITELQRAPVADWMDAQPPVPAAPSAAAAAEPATRAATAEPVTLDPYDAWRLHQTGDPRNTPRPQIMKAMMEIIEAEGPMTASRAYALYNRAAGGRKLTSVARAPLSSAIYWLAREDKITLTREADIPWQGDDMVRLPDQPAVRVRELGPRGLDEVPLDEIAELVKLLRVSRGTSDPTELKRGILSTYGLVRLTTRADEYLGLAIDLAD
jgi:dethiobiotin synthetase